MLLHPRQLRSRQGGYARALVNLVAPLAPQRATDTHTTDTSGQLDFFSPAGQPSGAVAVPIGPDPAALRRSDVQSAIDPCSPRTATTPGTRASTTAIRTTTTRATSSTGARSAGRHGAGFSPGELVRAMADCRRHKRGTASAKAYERRLEENLVELYDQLCAGTWQPGPSICFVITRPKPREVWAAGYADRVVHHLLYNAIAPRFERAFIADSCACIARRGTLYGARRLESKVRSITSNWTRPARYLKCDVASFFVSIDKRLLEPMLINRIPEPHLRSLTLQVLHHDPRQGAEFQSGTARLALIPKAKSLLQQPAHLGLPIGNLPSQFFANVYLDPLDQFIKHRLRAHHYVRYVDDFILLHESAAQLNTWHRSIAAFLGERLRLQLNESKTIRQPLERGVDFVGQVVKPWRRIIRRHTAHAALARISAMPAQGVASAANSYFGMFRQATHGAHDRARLGRVVMRRGVAVDQALTKAYG